MINAIIGDRHGSVEVCLTNGGLSLTQRAAGGVDVVVTLDATACIQLATLMAAHVRKWKPEAERVEAERKGEPR